jgi:hypothetical protein
VDVAALGAYDAEVPGPGLGEGFPGAEERADVDRGWVAAGVDRDTDQRVVAVKLEQAVDPVELVGVEVVEAEAAERGVGLEL